MAAGAARRPSGKVSAVFDRASDREGAYDLLESPHVKTEAIADGMFRAAAARTRGADYAYVVIDGSSLSLTDGTGTKGFGRVGNNERGGIGLKVMTALAVSCDGGVPLGVVDQIYWARSAVVKGPYDGRQERNRQRPFEDKEPAHFVHAAKAAMRRLEREGTRAWVVIDREGDNREILLALHRAGCLFTIRAGSDRVLWPRGSGSLRESLADAEVIGTYEVHVGRNGKRAARIAHVEVSAAQVTLRFECVGVLERDALRLYVVRLREVNAAADGLEWLLYTNAPVVSNEHAARIVDSYRTRWRIEEFHRTWKRGECNVEDAQLRSADAVIKWATILAAVATRIERLKYLSRREPETPATAELSPEEIEALKLDQRQRMKPKRKKLPEVPTMAQATQWVAELGGWIGLRNGPPGSSTLARGLERLGYLVEGMALARLRTPRARPK